MDKPIVNAVILANGGRLGETTIAIEAPQIPGFMALDGIGLDRYECEVDIVRYINLAQVVCIEVTPETLKQFGTELIVPDIAQKIKVKN